MSDRRRNLFILLLVAGLFAASLAVVSTQRTRLGLDLEGGVELVYKGKPTPAQPVVDAEAIDRAIKIMRERVDKLGVAEPEIQRFGATQISVGLPDVKNARRAQEQVGTTAQLHFYDWQPNVVGPEGELATSKPSASEVAAIADAPLPTLYDAVQRASKRKPETDKACQRSKDAQYYLFDKQRKLLAGPESRSEDLLSELDSPVRPAGSKISKINSGTTIVLADKPAAGAPDRWFVIRDCFALDGTDIKNPEQNFDQGAGGSGGPVVTMEFTAGGRKKFQQVTREIAQRGSELQVPGTPPSVAFQHFAIVLDDEIVSRPYISFTENPDGIDGQTGAQIGGSFTIDEAQTLANFLRIGALPIELELISQSQVSATLGQQALDEGLLAGAAGMAIVALFLMLFYRVLGLVAAVALGVYALYFFALIKLIPITLTLPGIAGLILTIGVAADANIVIFERVKEEIRGGRSVVAGIAQGYKKGFSTIVDANVVTLLTAFILFVLATAGVKGFAFTLGVGTLVSLFTAVLATQAILGQMSRTRLISHPSALGAGEQRTRWTFDFMGASKYFFSMSGVILLIGALAIGGQGLQFGIDFESGTRIKTALQKPATEDQIRTVMATAGYPDAKIQKLDEPELGKTVFQVSTPSLQPPQVQEVRQSLDKGFRVGNEFSNQSIGPTFGQTVASSALIAIIASLLVISIYIALRFEWKYAVPVLIALMHDLLITAGVYSLTEREVTTSTVAALLTILGFSLYDTIIVFDRVRENVPRMPRAAFSQIVNRSMAEVLTRSLATSFCTLLPVLALLGFGGETLTDFAFALLVGIASGTYSSVFIASPVLTHWKEREPAYHARATRIHAELGYVPAYATAVGGAPVDVEPEQRRGALPARSLTAPEQPGAVSPGEFAELVRDLHAGSAVADPVAEPIAEPPRERKPKREKVKKPRNRRHGRH